MIPKIPFPPAPSPDAGPSLYDYGVVGNLHTAALISRTGSVDWACLPRFASPSVFAGLLDPKVGGCLSIAPNGGAVGVQRYLASSNILETRFRIGRRGSLVLTDFMPIGRQSSGEGFAMLVRLLKATGAPVPVRVRCEPRFSYGRFAAKWETNADGLVARHEPDMAWYRIPAPVHVHGGVVESEFHLAPGESTAVSFGWGPVPPTHRSPLTLLEETRHLWREWVHAPSAPIHRVAGGWHGWVERSELLLKLLSHADTGAFVAAPTTSLPEWPGGTRNWDYRFVWVRDAAFTAQALMLLGHMREARGFLRWLLARIRGPGAGGGLRTVYGAHGETDLTERTLPHLAGFLGSRPVRVGNGAARQFQLDIYGELLDAALLLAMHDSAALEGHWPDLAGLVERASHLWRRPDRGIWEMRIPPSQYVHSKTMAWVALDRGARLAEHYGFAPEQRRWNRVAERIRQWILTHGYDEAHGFLQAEGRPIPDAANLRIPLVGFLPFDDARVLTTFDWIERELVQDPFVHRYLEGDGFAEPEGSFLAAAFWRVECLARSGEGPRAFHAWQELLAIASPLGLLPEEYDAIGRRPLGNFPQAFSHIGLLRAAVALGLSTAPLRAAQSVARIAPPASGG